MPIVANGCTRATTNQLQGDTIAGSGWPTASASPVRSRLSDPTLAASSRDDHPDAYRKRRHSPESLNPSCSTPNAANPHSAPKKPRSVSPGFLTAAVAGLRDEISTQIEPTPMPSPPESGPRTFSWEDDPFDVDADTTLHLLELYFMHVNSATYCMFPRTTFMHWVRTSKKKCQNQRMVLYALMAMGSVFADDALSGIAKTCADIVASAVQAKHGRLTIHLVIARLLLALYSFARGREGAAWDHCGSALRAIIGLRLNSEEGCNEDSINPEPRAEFGFTTEQLTECKRRLFWSGFLMDVRCPSHVGTRDSTDSSQRYNGFCGGMMRTIQEDDIFLRLPSTTEAFENSEPSAAPYFANEIIDPALAVLTQGSQVGPMAYLVMISTLWGDVLVFVYRNTRRSEATYADAYERFYHDLHFRMDAWVSRLPPHLQYNEANTDLSIRGGYAGAFISMHALFHFTLMKLNRCARHRLLAASSIRRNIRAAHWHAQELLRVMSSMREARRDFQYVPQGQNSMFAFSTPFPGYATLGAIDVLGAGGLTSELERSVALIGGGLICLRELSAFWTSAKSQRKAGEKRGEQIAQILTNPDRSRGGCWLRNEWGLRDPLEREFGLDSDCVYGVDDRMYYDALSEHGDGSSSSNVNVTVATQMRVNGGSAGGG